MSLALAISPPNKIDHALASKKTPQPSGGAAGVRNTKMLSFDADDEGEG